MIAFTNRSIVNGSLLRRFHEKNVSIMVNIETMDASGKTLSGKTTDNQTVQVCLSDPVTSPIDGWVEVIGIPTGPDRINCEEVTDSFFLFIPDRHYLELKMSFVFQVILFEQQESDEPFDTESYDMLVQFMYNCSDLYKSG